MGADHVVNYYRCFDRWFARHYYRSFEFSEWREIEEPQHGSNGCIPGPPSSDWQNHSSSERREIGGERGGYW